MREMRTASSCATIASLPVTACKRAPGRPPSQAAQGPHRARDLHVARGHVASPVRVDASHSARLGRTPGRRTLWQSAARALPSTARLRTRRLHCLVGRHSDIGLQHLIKG